MFLNISSDRGIDFMEQALAFSDEAYEIAEAYQLGKPISEYPTQSEAEKWEKAMSLTRLALFLGGLLLSAIFVGFAALFYFLLPQTPYTSDLFDHISDILDHFMIPGLLLFGAVMQIIFMLRAVLLMVKKLVTCTGGILTYRGKRLEATAWEQIRAIQLNVSNTQTRKFSSGSTLTYRIKRTNGSSFTLNSIWGPPVEAQYVQARAPLFLAQYESGVPLALGKLTLDSTGITRHAHTLPWYEFEMARVEQNPPRLSIFQRGNDKAWTTLRPRDVPSLALVERVIEQIRAKQDGIERAGHNPDQPEQHGV
jgi:hypothetical protein